MNLTTVARWIGAAGAAIAASAHISLYQDGYRDIPIANIGTQFLLNAAAGIAIAVGLLAPIVLPALPRWTTKTAAAGGVVWAVMSLLAYTLSHSDRGWMGYRDGPGFFMPSPEGALSVFSEATVLLACVLLLAVPLAGRAGSGDRTG